MLSNAISCVDVETIETKAYVYCNCQLSQNGRNVDFNQSFGKKGACLILSCQMWPKANFDQFPNLIS